MDTIVNTFWLLFADDAAAQPSMAPSMLMISVLAIFFLYMWIVQRPALKKEQDTRQTMLKSLKKNDRVLTTGGIYGVVTNVQLDSDEITLRVDEATSTKIKVLPSAIQRVVGDDAAGGKDSKESK
ncbi:MAG: preprotein translocase subunit YajC [Candidatus Saccharimonadales bacterium]